MDLEVIRELVKLMKENRLAEIDIESEGEHVRLRAEAPAPAPQMVFHSGAPAPAMIAAPGAHAAEAPGAPAAEPAEVKPHTVTIKSPIVGTFYHASSPDKPPFVHVGDTVDESSVLCIIEAMKVMNEIKAEMRGIVHAILVQNGQAVEFGQALFEIEPMP